jgi:hypothetical protein
VGVGINIHNHFALFALNSSATTYYVGFEDQLNGQDSGDYNDAIFRITTNAAGSAAPEPGTMSLISLSLLGLVLLGSRRHQKV